MSPRPRASRPQLERDPLGGGRVPSPRCASLVQALGASALRLSFTRERFWNVRSAAALLFLSLLPSAVPPQASLSSTDDPSPPVVDLVFHFETARRLIGLFDRSTISDEDLEGVLRFEDVRAIIRQAARFDSRATDQEFKRSLRAAVEGRELRDDLFQFQTVRARLAAIRTLLRRLQDSTQSLSRQVSDRIRAYSPRELNLQAEVHFVLGGSSDGWVPQPRSFYVALQYFEGDYEGLTLIMAHELFHVAQSEFMVEAASSGESRAVINAKNLLQQTIGEGTASMVGDPLRVSGGGSYVAWFRGKFERNLARIESNVALFDVLLYRLYHDPDADYQAVYKLGFSGTWDSPLYFVGYRIGRMIEKYDGRDALTDLLQRPPTAFFLRYIALYRSHQDPDLVRFSKETEEILEALHQPH